MKFLATLFPYVRSVSKVLRKKAFYDKFASPFENPLSKNALFKQRVLFCSSNINLLREVPEKTPPRIKGNHASVQSCIVAPIPDADLKWHLGHSTVMGISQIKANESIEDRALLQLVGNDLLLAAVIDGHGGWQVAEYVQRKLGGFVVQQLKQKQRIKGDILSPKDMAEALRDAFLALDQEILNKVAAPAWDLGLSRVAKIGACTTAVIVSPSSIVVANAGDCRAVLVQGRSARALSAQHSANEVAEQKRLKAEHPDEADIVRTPDLPLLVVCNHHYEEARVPCSVLEYPLLWLGRLGKEVRTSGCYVKGRLQPTRSFGDFYLKSSAFAYDHESGRPFLKNSKSFPYITAEPEINYFPRTSKDQILLLGTDGVWDFLDVNQASHIARKALQETPHDVPKAADQVIEAVVQKAMAEAGVASLGTLASLPAKQRRRIYDDTTVCLVRLSMEGVHLQGDKGGSN